MDYSPNRYVHIIGAQILKAVYNLRAFRLQHKHKCALVKTNLTHPHERPTGLKLQEQTINL